MNYSGTIVPAPTLGQPDLRCPYCQRNNGVFVECAVIPGEYQGMCGNCRRQDARHQCWVPNAVTGGAPVAVGPPVVPGSGSGSSLAPPQSMAFFHCSSFAPFTLNIYAFFVLPFEYPFFFSLTVNRPTIAMLKSLTYL